MLKLNKMTKKIIYDPVWGNLSANIVIVMIAFIFLRLTSMGKASSSLHYSSTLTGKIREQETLHSFQTENGHIVIYMVMGSLFLVFMIFLVRMIRGMMEKNTLEKSKDYL